MRFRSNRWLVGSVLAFGASLAAGCDTAATSHPKFLDSPAPLRMPSPAQAGDCECYEDSLTGGQVFEMYCAYCHNAPSLAERPFSQYQNVAAHMRVRANLTGKEYDKLMEFLRRWNDVPPPNPPVEPSPKRLIFSDPLTELRQKKPAEGEAPKPPPEKGQQAADAAPEGPAQ